MRSFALQFFVATAFLVSSVPAAATEKAPPKEAPVSDFDKYVKIETSVAGDGVTFPKAGDTVSCHYTLLVDGKKVDSSRDRAQPFQFQIGRGMVIKGWDEGLLKFSKGQRGVVTIQYQYGYGESGRPPQIPPKATLIFDVELLSITSR